MTVSIVSVYKPIYKERFYNEFVRDNLNLNLNNILYKSEKHQAHYDVAYKIFKDNYLFGVGLKNFRNESRKKNAMRGATPVLLKVLLFLKEGVTTLKNDATPNFISVSNSSILGLSTGISFVSEFFLKGG